MLFVRKKDGENKMEFPDLDNILSLLHKQPRMSLWTIDEENRINQQTIFIQV